VSDDDQLLRAWAGGDETAGNALIERHFDPLMRFFESTAPAHAEDLVQDTLRACLERLDRYRGDSEFRAYLFGIARNKLLMHWRTRGRRGPEVDIAQLSLEDLANSPSQQVAQTENERLLLGGLRRIPMDAQILLQLHYWESMPGPALAGVLDVPEGTVRSRLRKAKSQLVDAMRELADSEALWRETVDDLEAWAERVKKNRSES